MRFICGVSRGLVPFVQFKKTPMRSVTKHSVSPYIRALFNFSYIGSTCFGCDEVISKIADVSIILVW